MSKQVEVPEGVEEFCARICECGAVHDRPEVGCPECGSVIARAAGDAIFISDLLAIYKHFCDRLREVWTKAMADPAAFTSRRQLVDDLEQEEPLIDWQLRALEVALQAASIPAANRV